MRGMKKKKERFGHSNQFYSDNLANGKKIMLLMTSSQNFNASVCMPKRSEKMAFWKGEREKERAMRNEFRIFFFDHA